MAWLTVAGIGHHDLTKRRPVDIADPVVEDITGSLKVVQHIGAAFIAKVPEFANMRLIEPCEQGVAVVRSGFAERNHGLVMVRQRR